MRQKLMQFPSLLPSTPAQAFPCISTGVFGEWGHGRGRRGRQVHWRGRGSWQWQSLRGRARAGLSLAGSPGYPNEAAAEVVLTALREWLEQHKDKVRPGPSRGDWTAWDGGGIPGLLTSPMSHC